MNLSFYLFTIKFTLCRLSILPHRRTRRPCSRAAAAAHRTLLAKTPAVSLACVYRFQLCLLARRDEMSVFFEIFDDFFADHLSLKPAERRFDRFVIINCNKSHFLLTSSRPKI